jgi:hypothetical protein
MRTVEGTGGYGSKPQENAGDLAALTRLMALSCRVADYAQTLDGGDTVLMEAADKIAEEVGVWAERSGYTLDEVTRPLWEPQAPMSA